MVSAQGFQEKSHVLRHVCGDGNILACDGMLKGQSKSVESLPSDDFPRPAVEIVAQEGMAEVGEVDPYLMRAPRFQSKSQQTHGIRGFQGFIMGDGPLSLRGYTTSDDASRIPGDGSVDPAGGRRKNAVDHGKVLPVEELPSLGRELMVKLGFLCDEDESRGIPVQSVDGMKGDGDTMGRIIPQHRVGKGSRHFPVGGMDKLPAGLVHDEEEFVLIAYVKGKGFGQYPGFLRKFPGNDIPPPSP